ncbi:PREDICTED: universal stress protein A-like protein [Acropora digitifera]|uniref:universal stress protein A-like protein n=1 Tax=Acropora digitifera TaxID=70779 RepID=UPI00077AA6F6|nr:PREDICTED: universal stress protein A-like protein [Acropora digitifera]
MTECEGKERKVVLGVDASPHSERAFDWYCKNICNVKTDRLLIIHAQEYPNIPAAPYPYGYAYYEEWQSLKEKSDKQVKVLLESFGSKCKDHGLKFKLFKEESNRPGEVICKLAEDESVDLVVIGSRGMGTLRRTFLGSVSDYCVHHNHCSIAVVPPPNRHDGHAHST